MYSCFISSLLWEPSSLKSYLLKHHLEALFSELVSGHSLYMRRDCRTNRRAISPSIPVQSFLSYMYKITSRLKHLPNKQTNQTRLSKCTPVCLLAASFYVACLLFQCLTSCLLVLLCPSLQSLHQLDMLSHQQSVYPLEFFGGFFFS